MMPQMRKTIGVNLSSTHKQHRIEGRFNAVLFCEVISALRNSDIISSSRKCGCFHHTFLVKEQ